ncbi:hypothetical protein CsatB_023915 [Cannabis sativa]
MSPLLFVLDMEYLSKILKKVGEWPGFTFHDKCSSMKLNHLCFADDLLIFSNGDFISIMLMLKGLKLFSTTSSLLPNEQKTAIYCSGMANGDVQRILEASNFKRSSLPFRYLGIPICSRKISKAKCQELLEKMASRIRAWSTRNISYMGRVTLINVVLISIHTYWAQIMILPKKLLKDIEDICRSFLWKGIQGGAGPGLIAWDAICNTKNSGGLGFRNIQQWNIAALGRYVWDIASKKDCLFVRWIHSVYLKDQQWWEYDAPNDCSWYWKKVVGVKNRLKEKIGAASFLMQQYTIQGGYKLLFNNNDKVTWHRDVWDRLSIPKHKFIFWLVMWGRLNTKERIAKYDIHIDETCLFCGKEKESISHLFFACDYSRKCLQQLKAWLSWRTHADSIHNLL